MVNNSMVDCIVRLPDKLFLTGDSCLHIEQEQVMVKMAFIIERNNEIIYRHQQNGEPWKAMKLRVFYRC
jgi:type I restriction enzyme M protein